MANIIRMMMTVLMMMGIEIGMRTTVTMTTIKHKK
jgi:hypothetical protein